MTPEQDRTNNFLISMKEYSDKHPQIFPALTVFLDKEGKLYIHAGKAMTDSDIKKIATHIILSNPKDI